MDYRSTAQHGENENIKLIKKGNKEKL